jgi:glycosyltransferase involved in cell wall biosynthesis
MGNVSGWIVSQIGAREHYAVARGLAGKGQLAAILTDCWVPPSSPWGRVPGLGKLADRYHIDLRSVPVHHETSRGVFWELSARARRLRGWQKIMSRNQWYQELVKDQLLRMPSDASVFFSYSYTAAAILPLCHEMGWSTVVGQIDPGPVEERIVAEEHARFPNVVSTWTPAPRSYWDDWQHEMQSADHVVVNSLWSRRCLVEEGVDDDKISVIPLAYQPPRYDGQLTSDHLTTGGVGARSKTFDVLFLGQINLRKGIVRLIEAMRLLKSEPAIRLILAGPSEVSPTLWQDLPNVKYLGPVRRSHVGALYSSADVFILPTLSDGFALTQLEALGHGIPVIASTKDRKSTRLNSSH